MKVELERNKIVVENCEDFNISDILDCGQIFSYKKTGDNTYFVVSLNKIATIEVNQKNTIIYTKDIDYFYNFFDLNTNYQEIKNKLISQFSDFAKYLKIGNGIRILRQDPYQTIISFIVSANNNIKRIKNILFKISEKFGQKIEDTSIYSFPSLKDLSVATQEDFEFLGAGYRSKYLVKTLQQLNSSEYDINKLSQLSTKELKQKLIMLNGVGPKVADCILLFGFSRTDVFPVDTWIRKFYFQEQSKKMSDEKISGWFVNKYKNLSGFAQQYIYNYMINFK